MAKGYGCTSIVFSELISVAVWAGRALKHGAADHRFLSGSRCSGLLPELRSAENRVMGRAGGR